MPEKRTRCCLSKLRLSRNNFRSLFECGNPLTSVVLSHRARSVSGGTVEVTAKIIGMRPPSVVLRLARCDTRHSATTPPPLQNDAILQRAVPVWRRARGGVLLGSHVPRVSRFTCDTSWPKSPRVLFVARTLSHVIHVYALEDCGTLCTHLPRWIYARGLQQSARESVCAETQGHERNTVLDKRCGVPHK